MLNNAKLTQNVFEFSIELYLSLNKEKATKAYLKAFMAKCKTICFVI